MATEAQQAALEKARAAKASKVFQARTRAKKRIYRPRYLHGFIVDASEIPPKEKRDA